MGKQLAVKFPAGNSGSEWSGKAQSGEAGRRLEADRSKAGRDVAGWEQRWDRRGVWSASRSASSLLRPRTKAEAAGLGLLPDFCHQPCCAEGKPPT